MRKEKTREEKAIKNLQSVREGAMLTQEQFAGEVGVSTNTISRIERGKTSLSADFILKVHERFHVSTDYLFGLTSYEEGEPPCAVSCEELINAQIQIEMQDNIIKELRDKIDIIKNLVTGKEQPVKQRKPDCSD